MPDARLYVILRYMTSHDIDQVVDLDHLSFPTPWSARTYRYELTDGSRSKMFVLEQGNVVPQPTDAKPHSLIQWFVNQPARPRIPLLGYSGYWRVVDEAHISTIAVHPNWRGRKLGELLVWSMIRQAIRQRAKKITLEVRASNSIAQSLYYKYGFEIAGRRKGYYRNDGEDALTMAVVSLHERAYREMMVEYGKKLAMCLRVTDKL